MTSILIADAGKASMVMSSEVFKDKIPGASIIVAQSGEQVLRVLETARPDICMIDFDLPDVDGITLIQLVRKHYRGPIFLSAYPDNVVESAVKENLFAYDDVSNWVRKPVKFDDLAAKIEKYLVTKHRIVKRFKTKLTANFSIKTSAAKQKKQPKVEGKIINISLGGVCVKLDKVMKLKKTDTLMVNLDTSTRKATTAVKGKKGQKQALKKIKSKTQIVDNKRKPLNGEPILKTKIAWTDNKCLGLKFSDLTAKQRAAIELMLRNEARKSETTHS